MFSTEEQSCFDPKCCVEICSEKTPAESHYDPRRARSTTFPWCRRHLPVSHSPSVSDPVHEARKEQCSAKRALAREPRGRSLDSLHVSKGTAGIASCITSRSASKQLLSIGRCFPSGQPHHEIQSWVSSDKR